MCAAIAEIARLARAASLDSAWRQWASLGAPIMAQDPARSVIDPEALLLLSAYLRASERRLDDVLAWWAAEASTLLSVQRTTTLLRAFPAGAGAGVAAFAGRAAESGDARWARLARAPADGLARGKRGHDPRITRNTALVLRLRAGFGVGVKADLLALLMSGDGHASTIATLTEASAYTPAAIRRAAREMEAADFVQRVRGRPAGFYIDPSRWAAVVGSPGAGWRWFAQVFAFLASVDAWGAEHAESSPYIASTAARELIEAHRPAFEMNRVSIPNPADVTGEACLDAFAASVQALVEWSGASL